MSDTKNRSRMKLMTYGYAPIISTCLLVAAMVGFASGDHHILRSSCSSTLYPDLCYATLATSPEAAVKLTSHKDVIEASLAASTATVERNYQAIKKLAATRKNLTPREKIALGDCLETSDETLDELRKAAADLKEYPSRVKSLAKHADDIKTLLSAAMTNQETCLDGFSYGGADEKRVRSSLYDDEKHAERLCSNALAMVRNMTDADIAAAEAAGEGLQGRRLMADGWPEWLSAGDRRLLQARAVTPNVVVAADGTGDYKTVGEAVAAAPERSSSRYVIRIKAGVYRENVEVTKKKTNIMFMGDGRKNTIITGNKNVVDGSTTFHSATVAVVGERFLARDITFENTAGPSKHQAVALRVGSDLSAFYQCDMLAYQDTLYVHNSRQFFINCLIAGTVDFIFGNAAAVLVDCDIHARLPRAGQRNMVTAQGRTDPNQNTGIVIQKCRIGATSDLLPVRANFPTYLGRPWKEYSRTVVMQTSISDVIHPAGWFEWSGNFALSTLYYAEHANSGAGSGTGARVAWAGFKVIDATEARQFTPGEFIAGASWLPATTFPYSLGL